MTKRYETNLQSSKRPIELDELANSSSDLSADLRQDEGGPQVGRKSTLLESIVNFSIRSGPQNKEVGCLLTFLLSANLVAAIINTLLLALVVKSIELNDRGFMKGHVSWDSHLLSTVLEVPAKLSDRSISLHSVKSIDDQNLRLEKKCPTSICSPEHRFIASSSGNHEKSYLAVNLDPPKSQQPLLEFGTHSMRLDLLSSQKPSSPQTKINQNTVFDFDGQSPSQITLPMARTLEIESDSIKKRHETNHIEIQGSLYSNQIEGGVETNLNLQNRQGNLQFKSAGSMQLVSRVSRTSLSASQSLLLDAPRLELSSPNGLYISGGIEFFDGEPEAETREAVAETIENSELVAKNLILVGHKLMAL